MKSISKQNLTLAAAAVAVLAGIAWFSLRNTAEQSGDSAVGSLAADVLNPNQFGDERTRAAYQTAKDIPEVLEQLPCFCGCASLGHKNNLFCFKDQHGAGCNMCQSIALDARQMHDQGISTAQIRENIKAKYSGYQE